MLACCTDALLAGLLVLACCTDALLAGLLLLACSLTCRWIAVRGEFEDVHLKKEVGAAEGDAGAGAAVAAAAAKGGDNAGAAVCVRQHGVVQVVLALQTEFGFEIDVERSLIKKLDVEIDLEKLVTVRILLRPPPTLILNAHTAARCPVVVPTEEVAVAV